MREFLIFSALGATVWAITFASLGYAFGRALAVFLGHLAHYEKLAMALIVVGGLCAVLWRYHRRRLREQAK